jgi:hypothetical protein
MSKSKQTSSKTLKVKTNVKAGPRRWVYGWSQHNETQVREPKNAKTLKVKTSVKAGCYCCSNARRWANGWLP